MPIRFEFSGLEKSALQNFDFVESTEKSHVSTNQAMYAAIDAYS